MHTSCQDTAQSYIMTYRFLLVVMACECVRQSLQGCISITSESCHYSGQDNTFGHADDQSRSCEANHAAQVDPSWPKMPNQPTHNQREEGWGSTLQEQAQTAHTDSWKKNVNSISASWANERLKNFYQCCLQHKLPDIFFPSMVTSTDRCTASLTKAKPMWVSQKALTLVAFITHRNRSALGGIHRALQQKSHCLGWLTWTITDSNAEINPWKPWESQTHRIGFVYWGTLPQ